MGMLHPARQWQHELVLQLNQPPPVFRGGMAPTLSQIGGILCANHALRSQKFWGVTMLGALVNSKLNSTQRCVV